MIVLADRYIRLPTVIAALAVVLFAIPLWQTTKSLKYGEFEHDLTNPVLAMELAASGPEVTNVLDLDPEKLSPALRRHTEWDLAFILACGAFFWSLSDCLARRELRPFVRALILISVVAGCVEAAGVFQTLAVQKLVGYTRYAALIKWTAVSFLLILIALQLAKTRLRPYERTFTGLLTIVVFLAGLAGFTGLANSPDAFLPGVFSYRHLSLMIELAAVLPLACLLGAFLAWRGVLMHDSAPLVPLTDDPPQVLGPHT